MPRSPNKACIIPGCLEYAIRGSLYCSIHRKSKIQRINCDYGYLYGDKWQKYRVIFLRANPICVRCSGIATVVDHIEDHKGDVDKFWDCDNHQPLCTECHNKKTYSTTIGRKRKK